MSSFSIGLIIGLWAGCFIGVFLMALVQLAKKPIPKQKNIRGESDETLE